MSQQARLVPESRCVHVEARVARWTRRNLGGGQRAMCPRTLGHGMQNAKRKMYSIGPSLPLPDGSTTPSRPSLTSLFAWEAVTLGDVAAHGDSRCVHVEARVARWTRRNLGGGQRAMCPRTLGHGMQNAKRKMYSIGPSLPLPDGSTTPTRPSLTSLFEWEAVTLGDVAAHGNRSPKLYTRPKQHPTWSLACSLAQRCRHSRRRRQRQMNEQMRMRVRL